MLKLRFFASIREALGSAELDLDFGPHCVSVTRLLAHLDGGRLPGCRRWLAAPNTLVAVNQEIAGPDAALSDGDEVAFYPPVTGG